MLNILCTGHGTAAFGCSVEYNILHIECNAHQLLAICPHCGTKTVMGEEYDSIFPLESFIETVTE